MVQIAPKGRQARGIIGPRANASNLQRLVPIRIQDHNPNNQCAVRLPFGKNADRIPHPGVAVESHSLAHTKRKAPRLGRELFGQVSRPGHPEALPICYR